MRALRARTDQRPGGPECRHSGSVTSVAHRHCISPVPCPRQTKKEQKKLPTKFYIGTVADTPGDSRGDRLTKKERKRTIAHSLLADEKFQYVSIMVASRHLAALFGPCLPPCATCVCFVAVRCVHHLIAVLCGSVPRGDNFCPDVVCLLLRLRHAREYGKKNQLEVERRKGGSSRKAHKEATEARKKAKFRA